jgi:copper resistance protein B
MRRLALILALLASPALAQHAHHAPATAADSTKPPPQGWAADPLYPPGAMAKARAAMLAEHGGMTFSQLMLNLAEVTVRDGRDGYRWNGEYWRGGDIDRLTIKSEGEGTRGRKPEGAEAQLLWSHAVDPYWNLQAGLRQDFRPDPDRTHLAIGVEGLAPYWFEVDVSARLESWYDQRITQRLVLQPRIELNLSADDVPERGIGKGLSEAELGLRLRYEIEREFAPYVGVSHAHRFGRTARLTRAAGDDARETSLVVGLRFWL